MNVSDFAISIWETQLKDCDINEVDDFYNYPDLDLSLPKELWENLTVREFLALLDNGTIESYQFFKYEIVYLTLDYLNSKKPRERC